MHRLLVGLLLLSALARGAAAQEAPTVQVSFHAVGDEFNVVLNTPQRRVDLEKDVEKAVLDQLTGAAHRTLVVGTQPKKASIIVTIKETQIELGFRTARGTMTDPFPPIPLYNKGEIFDGNVSPKDIVSKVKNVLTSELQGHPGRKFAAAVGKAAPLVIDHNGGALKLLQGRGVLPLAWASFCELSASQFKLTGDGRDWFARGSERAGQWRSPGKKFKGLLVRFVDKAPGEPDRITSVTLDAYQDATCTCPAPKSTP